MANLVCTPKVSKELFRNDIIVESYFKWVPSDNGVLLLYPADAIKRVECDYPVLNAPLPCELTERLPLFIHIGGEQHRLICTPESAAYSNPFSTEGPLIYGRNMATSLAKLLLWVKNMNLKNLDERMQIHA